jgi:acyl carrier protein
MTPAIDAEAIRRFILDELAHEPDLELGEDEPIFSSGLLDSFAVTRLMIFLEDRAGIRIPAGEVTLADFDTLRSCLAVAARRMGQATSR